MKTAVLLCVLGATCCLALQAVLQADTAVNGEVFAGRPDRFYVPEKLRTPTARIRLFRLSTFSGASQHRMCLLPDMELGECIGEDSRARTELGFADDSSGRFLYVSAESESFRYMLVLCDGECHNIDLTSYECPDACHGLGVCEQRVCRCDSDRIGDSCEDHHWPDEYASEQRVFMIIVLVVWVFFGLAALIPIVCCVGGLIVLCHMYCCKSGRTANRQYAPLPGAPPPAPPSYSIAVPMTAVPQKQELPPPYWPGAMPTPTLYPLPQLAPIQQVPPPVVVEPATPTVAPGN